MTDTNGYIKLHRSILSWEWYSDINTRGLFIHLLLSARWEDTRCMGQVIKRGQVCTTVRELSELNGLTSKEVRTALVHLQTTGEIMIQSTPHFSIFTIVNYEAYQGETRGANKGQTELPENGKPKGKQNGKPNSPETANGLPLENGFAAANESNEQSADGKQICTSGANQMANETANKGQTEIAEKGKPTYINKNKEILRSEEVSVRTRASGAVSNVLETAVREYNKICKSLEPLTGELSYHQGRLVVEAFKELHGVSFAEYFRRVEGSAFLTGKSSSSFKADFNWLIRPENVAKVLSGKYDKNFESGAVTTSPAKKDYDEPLWDD